MTFLLYKSTKQLTLTYWIVLWERPSFNLGALPDRGTLHHVPDHIPLVIHFVCSHFFWQTGFYNPSFKDSVNPFLNFAINFHISPFLFQYWHASLSEIEFISGNWPFIKRFQYRVNWQTLTYLGNQIFTLFSQHRQLPEVNSASLYAIIICHISVHI